MHGETRIVEGIWWQIAIGVFLGLLGHSIVLGLYARYEVHKATEAMNAELQRLSKGIKQTTHAVPTERPNRPLDNDERCIQGRRFKRLENGWQQIPHDPC